MPYFKRCEIKNTYKEEQFEWKITNFFSFIGTGDQVEHEDYFGSSLSEDISCIPTLVRERGSDWWLLYLRNDDDSDAEVKYPILGFRKIDGSLDRSLLIGDDDDCYYHFTESKLMKRKHEFTTSDSLTIICTIKCGTSYYPQPKLDQPTPIKLTKLDTLSENFKNMFINKGSCDVSLQVKNKVFDAHKAILIARSSVFSTMLEPEMMEKQTHTVNIPDYDPEIFQKFLQYLYCGKLEDISFQEVLELYSISNKFNIKELKYFCVQYMEQCLTVNNICDIIILAEKNDEVKLLSLAQRFFCKNLSKIENTLKWKDLLTNNSELASRLTKGLVSKVKV